MWSGHGKVALLTSRRRLWWGHGVLLALLVAVPHGAPGESGDQPALAAQATGGPTEPAPIPAPPAAPPSEMPLATPPPPTIPSVPPPVFPPLPPTPTATFELHPSVELTEEYTDNFGFAEQGKQDNFRTTASLSLSLLTSAAYTQGQLAYKISGNYDTVDDGTSLFHSLQAWLGWQATPRLTLTVFDAFKHTDAPEEADQLNLRRGRQTFTSNTAGLNAGYVLATVSTSAFYQFSTFSGEDTTDTASHAAGASATASVYGANTVSVGYQYLKSDVSGTEQASGSHVTGHQGTLSLSRRLNPWASAGVSGSYAVRDITSDVPEDPGEDYSIWSASLFAAYGIPDRWTLSASVGYSYLDARRGANEWTINGGLALSVRFARGTFTLSGSSGFSETFATGENFGVVETRGVQGSLSYPLTPSVTGTVAAFYRQNEFTSVVVGEAGRTEAGQTEDVWGGTVRVSTAVTRWLTLALEYGYTNAGSPVPGRKYTENRARLTATAAF